MGRKSNAPQRREQIIWALYECLSKKGHEKVTIKEIATKANLPSGVIHYYFKSKDEIVSMLAEAITEKYSKILEEVIAKANSIEQRIESLIDFLVDSIFDYSLNRVFYNLIQMAFEREQLHEVMKKMLMNYRKELALRLEEASAGQESHFLGAALVAIVEGFSVQLMIDQKILKKSDVRQLIVRAVSDLLVSAANLKKN
jgi:DNA-binding transcriptional regulator YbjK